MRSNLDFLKSLILKNLLITKKSCRNRQDNTRKQTQLSRISNPYFNLADLTGSNLKINLIDYSMPYFFCQYFFTNIILILSRNKADRFCPSALFFKYQFYIYALHFRIRSIYFLHPKAPLIKIRLILFPVTKADSLYQKGSFRHRKF